MLLQVLLPRRVVFVDELRRLFRVPAVAVAALWFDLHDVVADDVVAPFEDGAVGADLVEARPERRGLRVFDDRALESAGLRLVLLLDPADTGELRGVEPGDGRLDRLDDSLVWVLDAHEEARDGDALLRGERDRLALAPGCLRGRDLVGLRTP